MKNRIDYGSLNLHSCAFLLDKFLESDAPATLSWLDMDANDLNSDISVPLEEPYDLWNPDTKNKKDNENRFTDKQEIRELSGAGSRPVGQRRAS
jgi:hypothetical protein